jgi:hypothetical protein
VGEQNLDHSCSKVGVDYLHLLELLKIPHHEAPLYKNKIAEDWLIDMFYNTVLGLNRPPIPKAPRLAEDHPSAHLSVLAHIELLALVFSQQLIFVIFALLTFSL